MHETSLKELSCLHLYALFSHPADEPMHAFVDEKKYLLGKSERTN